MVPAPNSPSRCSARSGRGSSRCPLSRLPAHHPRQLLGRQAVVYVGSCSSGLAPDPGGRSPDTLSLVSSPGAGTDAIGAERFTRTQWSRRKLAAEPLLPDDGDAACDLRGAQPRAEAYRPRRQSTRREARSRTRRCGRRPNVNGARRRIRQPRQHSPAEPGRVSRHGRAERGSAGRADPGRCSLVGGILARTAFGELSAGDLGVHSVFTRWTRLLPARPAVALPTHVACRLARA